MNYFNIMVEFQHSGCVQEMTPLYIISELKCDFKNGGT